MPCREVRELEALELARQGEAPQQGAAAPASGQQAEDARRAALLLSGEEAWKRRGMAPAAPPGDGQGLGGLGAPGGGGGLGFAGFGGGGGGGAASASGQPKGMSLAQRMLEKMGWKEGEGLGRNRQGAWLPRSPPAGVARTCRAAARCRATPPSSQPPPTVPAGMATPLMMQKVDVRTGVIVNAAPTPGGGAEQQPAKRPRSATFEGPPTRVILLTNMVRCAAPCCAAPCCAGHAGQRLPRPVTPAAPASLRLLSSTRSLSASPRYNTHTHTTPHALHHLTHTRTTHTHTPACRLGPARWMLSWTARWGRSAPTTAPWPSEPPGGGGGDAAAGPVAWRSVLAALKRACGAAHLAVRPTWPSLME
jgi:hypothetical protein